MKSVITVVSLGSGDPDLLNMKTVKALRNASVLVLRTSRHPIVSWLVQEHISYESFDNLYDEAEEFDKLNQLIVSRLLQISSHSSLVYAVPDASTDCSVRLLFTAVKDKSLISIIPGVAFYDTYLASSLPFLSDSEVSSVSASVFVASRQHDPNINLLITELDNHLLTGQIKILLTETLEDDHLVYMFFSDRNPVALPLYMIDRQKNIDHRSALLIPGTDFHYRSRYVIQDLIEIVDILRSQNGCPWDRVQTHESLRPYMIEEAWECVAAVDQDDMDHLCEELGDLLFQIVFHSSVGKNFEEFTMNDITTGICKKMLRRHPHVFGNLEQPPDWEHLKQVETGHISAADSLEDVSSGLPSLKYAQKIMKKLYNQTDVSGRECNDIVSDISALFIDPAKIHEHPSHCLGILLMLCVELCYKNGTDSETVLHEAVDRLKEKIQQLRSDGLNDGKSFKLLTLTELGVYLQYVEGEIE